MFLSSYSVPSSQSDPLRSSPWKSFRSPSPNSTPLICSLSSPSSNPFFWLSESLTHRRPNVIALYFLGSFEHSRMKQSQPQNKRRWDRSFLCSRDRELSTIPISESARCPKTEASAFFMPKWSSWRRSRCPLFTCRHPWSRRSTVSRGYWSCRFVWLQRWIFSQYNRISKVGESSWFYTLLLLHSKLIL